MALNFIEKNLIDYFHIPSKQYSTQVSSNTIKSLKQDNLFLWKIMHAVSDNVKENQVLWTNYEEEVLIKQWMEYANTFVLQAGSQSIAGALSELNHVFARISFLVSNRITLADIFLYYSLITVFKDLSFQNKEKYQHLSRWFNYLQSNADIRGTNDIIPFSKTFLY